MQNVKVNNNFKKKVGAKNERQSIGNTRKSIAESSLLLLKCRSIYFVCNGLW